jgi:hypothetical protein
MQKTSKDKQKTFEYLAAAGYERVRKSLIFEQWQSPKAPLEGIILAIALNIRRRASNCSNNGKRWENKIET